MEVAGAGKGATCASLLRGLIAGDLSRVRLMVSDDHEGIKAAVFGKLAGAEWQQCVIYFERNVVAHVPTSSMTEVTEHLRAIFKARRAKTARAPGEEFAELYAEHFPRAVSVFEASVEDAIVYLRYPGSHHARTRTTNMLE